MKSTLAHFPTKAGAILGFLVMVVVGWNLPNGPVPAPNNVTTLESQPKRIDREPRRSKSTGPAALAAKRLDSIRAAGTQQARLGATFALANSLSASEIAAWLNGGWFTIQGGPERLLFRNILLARWREMDPEGLLGWSLKNDMRASRKLLESWSEKEPQRLIEFFKNHPNEAAEMAALGSLAKAHPGLALQRLQEMADDGMSGQKAHNSLAICRQLAERSPAALEAALDSLSPQLKKQAESALCGQRLAASFSTEIRVLWDQPNGWEIFQSNLNDDSKMKLFAELANMPPAWRASIAKHCHYLLDENSAVKWLDTDLVNLGFSATQVKRLRVTALNNLASKNPEETLKRMDDVELSVDVRKALIFNMFSFIENEPEKTASLIARLNSEEDREQARELLAARKNNQSGGKVDPVDWLEKISGIDPKSAGNASEYFRSMERWSADEIAQLSQRFSAMPDDKKMQVAQVMAAGQGLNNSSSSITGAAIRHLVANSVARPEGQNASGIDPLQMASVYASRLAVKDPGDAKDWVGSLPAGEAKLWAQKNMAKNWAAYDQKAAAQWVESLPADARREVQAFMKK